MIPIWTCYPTISWVYWEAWITSDRLESANRLVHDHQLHLRHAQPLPWILELRAWTMHLISGVVVVIEWWWWMDGYNMQPLYECYMRHGPHLIGMNHTTDHFNFMTFNYTQTYLAVTLDIGRTKNHGPHQWACSDTKGWWHRYRYTIPPFHECYMRHGPRLTDLDHPTYHHMTSNCTLDILSCYPGGYLNKELESLTSPMVCVSSLTSSGGLLAQLRNINCRAAASTTWVLAVNKIKIPPNS